ncbi:hypothetical protein [Algoriphagus boritolerans]|uniref:hypothetical protein n=1 Tax=Algoriphagus boritolerans TaxID=308111 RepID=UPI002FCE38D4
MTAFRFDGEKLMLVLCLVVRISRMLRAVTCRMFASFSRMFALCLFGGFFGTFFFLPPQEVNVTAAKKPRANVRVRIDFSFFIFDYVLGLVFDGQVKNI